MACPLWNSLLRAPAWRGHSNTETLLAAFDQWGLEATLKRTVGMFAIALWDRRERTLHLARDRPAGSAIRREDIAIKSPGGGLPPYEIDKLIGRSTRVALKADQSAILAGLNPKHGHYALMIGTLIAAMLTVRPVPPI